MSRVVRVERRAALDQALDRVTRPAHDVFDACDRLEAGEVELADELPPELYERLMRFVAFERGLRYRRAETAAAEEIERRA